MLYGTTMRTPSKRRIAGTPTPGKVRKVGVCCTFIYHCVFIDYAVMTDCRCVKRVKSLYPFCFFFSLSNQLNGTSTLSTPTSFLSSGLGGTKCQSSFLKAPLSASKVRPLSLFCLIVLKKGWIG